MYGITHSENAMSAVNQQERPVKNRLKVTILSLGMMLVGYLVGQFIVFNLIVDPLIVPLIGFRPVLAAVTIFVCLMPGIKYAVKNKSFC